MPQPEFIKPDFLDESGVEEIHQRMMNNLPADIDDMPGGFAYDFTRPTAIEKSEILDFHIVRTLMAMFPQYAWEGYLDLHGQQVHITRHPEQYARGTIRITGEPDTVVPAGSVFLTPGTDKVDSYEFITDTEAKIPEEGVVDIPITAGDTGPEYNVAANAITLMDDPNPDIESVTNPDACTGGTDEETDDDYYDRIAAEYANSRTYLGNDSDYIRWAKEAGAGDCIVDPASDGPGTVSLILIDQNGQPANQELLDTVYDYIVSPNDRSQRLLPTACAQLLCKAAVTARIDFSITGLQFTAQTDLERIKADFAASIKSVFSSAKTEGILRYNDVRPIISDIVGVEDFDTFTMNGDTRNITLAKIEYPEVGTLDFS